MGTRGIMGFRYKETDHFIYNQFDMYPDGCGAKMLEFVKKRSKISPINWADLLKVRVEALVRIDSEALPTAEQKEALKKFTDLRVSRQSTNDWYCLLRATQGDPDLMLKAKYYDHAGEFVRDSLFCEWGYILNLDTLKLECYRGFVKGLPGEGRYSALGPSKDTPDYEPISLFLELPVSEILTQPTKVLVKRMEDDAELHANGLERRAGSGVEAKAKSFLGS